MHRIQLTTLFLAVIIAYCSANWDYEFESCIVSVTGNGNVPKFTWWKKSSTGCPSCETDTVDTGDVSSEENTGDDEYRTPGFPWDFTDIETGTMTGPGEDTDDEEKLYRLQFNQLYEVKDEDKVPQSTIALASLTWEWTQGDNGFNLTCGDDRVNITIVVHLMDTLNRSCEIDFDVIISNYVWIVNSSDLVLVYSMHGDDKGEISPTEDTGDTGVDTMEDTMMEDTSEEDTAMEDTSEEDTGGEDTSDTGLPCLLINCPGSLLQVNVTFITVFKAFIYFSAEAQIVGDSNMTMNETASKTTNVSIEVENNDIICTFARFEGKLSHKIWFGLTLDTGGDNTTDNTTDTDPGIGTGNATEDTSDTSTDIGQNTTLSDDTGIDTGYGNATETDTGYGNATETDTGYGNATDTGFGNATETSVDTSGTYSWIVFMSVWIIFAIFI